MATLDPPLDVLRGQILACTSLAYGEIGWIAGADHRQSGPHFPEYPAPSGNPPYEVDAIDVPHAPSRGADMAVLTEALRLSRDPRIRLVIFNRRIFSSYDHAEGDPWTWRPYDGENPHDKHAHVERNDSHRGDLRPWSIGIDNGGLTMFLAACKVGDKATAHVQTLMYALYDLHAAKYGGNADYRPLYPGNPGSPTLPATFTAATGAAMKDLLEGGDGVNFTPLLCKRLLRKLGALDTPPVVTEPGGGVTADQARTIAAEVVRDTAVTLTPSV